MNPRSQVVENIKDLFLLLTKKRRYSHVILNGFFLKLATAIGL